MNPLVEQIKRQLAQLDTTANRAEVAHLTRQLLQVLAPVVEGIKAPILIHAGEVLAFNQLDALLAKIEASALAPATA